MKKGKAIISDKITISTFKDSNRGIQATKDIMNEEELLFVPITQILRFDKTMNTPLATKIVNHFKNDPKLSSE